jgi:hypothetical protein
MSDAIAGTGIMLHIGDGASPEVFTPVAELVSLKPSAKSRNKIEVSNHNEKRESNILGMLRQSDVTGTCNLVPSDATHESIQDDIDNNVKRNWRITLPPDGLPHYTFPARVQLFEFQEVTPDSALQFAFALTIDGDITVINT